jgi:phage-related protein
VGFNFVKNNFLNFVQLAISLVNGNWRVAMSSLFSIAKSAVDGISSLFGNLARTIGSIAKAISDTVGKAASIGSSIQGKIPGFAVGTSYFPGGIADVHKDERVILPAGAKVQTAATANRERQKEQASNSISFSPVINFNGFTKPNREEIKEIFDDLKPEFIKFLQQKQVM